MTDKIISNIKSNSKKINTWIGDAIRKNIKSLEEIKAYLNEEGGKQAKGKLDSYSKIIQTVLQARMKENKVILREGTFNKELKLYLSAASIPTKCLTNDILYLLMVSKRILISMDIDEDLEDLYLFSNLDKVTIISQNFLLDEPTVKGYIQDYDSEFSGICTPYTRDDKATTEIVDSKPNIGTFKWGGDTYKYFGNTDICVVALSNYDDQTILGRLKNMVYLKNERNMFSLGERRVSADNKIKFLYQELKPESFCPSFWFSPQEINCNFFFEYSVGYYDLLDYIYDDKTSTFRWPDNLFYWENMQQCFDFLAVVGLTSLKITEQQKNQIADWIDDFAYSKSELLKIKNAQSKVERVFHDFLNSFLNNSTFERYVNLLTKAEQVLKAVEDNTKLEYYTEAVAFLNQLPFCRMINNQMKPGVTEILKNVVKVLKDFVKGTKPSSIINDIRGVAREIYALLPGKDMINACFPFIAAGGGLVGDLISFNNKANDPVYARVDKQVNNQKKKAAKKKKDQEDEKDVMMNRDDVVREYFTLYIENRPKNAPKISDLVKRDIVNLLVYWFNNIAGERNKALIIKNAQTAKETKKYKKELVIDQFVKDMLEMLKPRKRGTAKTSVVFKAAQAGLTALQKANANIDSTKLESNDKMEVEEESDEEDEKSK